MQNDIQQRNAIKLKLQELAELEKQVIDQQESDPGITDLFEESNQQSQPGQPHPQQQPPKYYDLEQVVIVMACETINNILIDHPMSELKQSRLLIMRNALLHEMDLDEFIPPEPQKLDSNSQTQPDSDKTDILKSISEPELRNTDGDEDLDIISQKLKDIDSENGLMKVDPEEPEPTGLKKLLSFGSQKKKPADPRDVDEKHQPTSMG